MAVSPFLNLHKNCQVTKFNQIKTKRFFHKTLKIQQLHSFIRNFLCVSIMMVQLFGNIFCNQYFCNFDLIWDINHTNQLILRLLLMLNTPSYVAWLCWFPHVMGCPPLRTPWISNYAPRSTWLTPTHHRVAPFCTTVCTRVSTSC